MPDALTIIHATDRYAVIDKPSGLLSVPGKGVGNQDCAAARVRAHFPRSTGPLVVHRLDMDTSGLLVFGLDPEAQRELSVHFAERRVEKSYTAVVAGHVQAERGEVNAPIRPDLTNRPVQIVDEEFGKPSLTHWRVLALEPDSTRVELIPMTGRTHQLRLHMAIIGHAILGDVLYGPQPDTARAADRLLLHATMLEFPEPGTGHRVRFEVRPAF